MGEDAFLAFGRDGNDQLRLAVEDDFGGRHEFESERLRHY